MKFDDPSLQQIFERNMTLATGVPEDQRAIFAVFDIIDRFKGIEGDDSPRVCEAIRHLLSEDLRPALRLWYQESGDNINTTALEYRDRLSKLAGERFG